MGSFFSFIKEEILKSDLFSVILAVFAGLGVFILLREGIMNIKYFIEKRKKLKGIDSFVDKRNPNRPRGVEVEEKELKVYLIKGVIYLLISLSAIGYVYVNKESIMKFYGM